MAENSSIEWTTHTFNPWRGCTKVSAGCANCYADTMSKRNPRVLGIWGPQGTRVVAAASQWKESLKWERDARREYDLWYQGGGNGRVDMPKPERPRVFCASLADVFEDWTGYMVNAKSDRLSRHSIDDNARWFVTNQEELYSSCHRPLTMKDVRNRLFQVIDQTPNLDWLLLTKRPDNIERMMPPNWLKHVGTPVAGATWKTQWMNRWSLPDNIWLGTSAENQQALDERVPHLLQVPAKVRFLSCEPLLGPLDLGPYLGPWTCGGEAGVGKHDGKNGPGSYCGSICRDYGKPRGPVDWVIVGGESGPDARPCRVEWIRDIVNQCKAAGVPVFVKQLGSQPIESDGNGFVRHSMLRDPKGGDMSEWPEDLRVREFPEVAL